ncbi:MAG: SDR family NAD(P)-dependent oxidoreductase [Phycisphaerae bacterium]|jgi:NAD(P)-dependent dehydrogenase (short-subunit alcohol dehydrogenase family)|nr:SDR family NAD(P)-dependent oxidoreductase [Phycisphaerae bacterium]MCZ2401455.1 SDR family NAD(P)-dependent oxidoreductase [Phycisphaerae bacterium]NUQ50704.1 SDR family NAD(P)-dependent oxidoreductase [Phycisphaerae bacterium]
MTTNGDTWKRNRLDLSKKVAVVTGGARGIGEATGYELAREGIKAVAVVDVAADVADFAAEGNAHFKRDVFVPFRGDVTDSAFRKRVFTEMQKQHGPVSICVPAAGITKDRLAVRLNKETGQSDVYPEEDFRRVMEIDLTAPIYWAIDTIASVAEDRARRGLKRWDPSEPIEGCVIFIGSVSSAGNKGQISYATAKAGLEGAQATLAAEAMFYGVRSAIIHPGYTDTQMVAALGRDFISEHILPHTQLRRLISPSEIAHAIVFMIQNSAVSGQLWVDAGWHPAV